MDSQLFAIKQLLVLREQIAPFEADFAVVERDLGGWGWGGRGAVLGGGGWVGRDALRQMDEVCGCACVWWVGGQARWAQQAGRQRNRQQAAGKWGR